ncbi:MAG: polysaccharide pyruvyl transferase family protein [Armatimonadetes bacterium]|nr:polysaccharide pyruvyl transferase family protein [Armatimonadota bacterium]
MMANRILLLMDNRQDPNWGSQATTHALVDLLRRYHPGAEVRGLPRAAARPRGTVQRRVCEVLAPGLATAGRWEGWTARLVLDLLTSSWRHQIEWADLIVVNGEGTLHHQRQTRRWMPVIAALPFMTKAPVWVVNCSVEVRGSRSESLFKSALSKAERIAVREPVSGRELREMGLKAEDAADCAFLTEPSTEQKVDAILKKVGISGPFAVMTGTAVVRRWDPATQSRLARRLLDSGRSVLYAASTPGDLTNYRRLTARTPLPLVTHKEATFQELMGVLGRADLLIGGRFHLLILAALSGTPFVAVPSNTHKTAGLMEMLQTEDMLYAIDDEEGQLSGVARALEDPKARGKSLQERTGPLAKKAILNVTSSGVEAPTS